MAGFFAGYVSSTAATAGFGQRVRETPALLSSAVGATMFANLASVSLVVAILLAVAPALMTHLWLELAAACAVLAVGGALGVHRGEGDEMPAPTSQSRMFSFRHALLFAGAITGAVIAAAAELHAAVAKLGNLAAGGRIGTTEARWAMLGLLAASSLAKTIVAFTTGGARFGLRVGAGLLLAVAAASAVVVSGWRPGG